MTEPATKVPESLYEHDYPLWARRQAAFLRARQWDRLDLTLLAEEIDDMGRRDRDAIENHLINLLFHLLKWQYQPEHRSSGWLGSIREARIRIAQKIRRAPSLADHPAAVLQDAWQVARARDPQNDSIDPGDFPEHCPWPLAKVLDPDWLP